jgi:hypothetical protein
MDAMLWINFRRRFRINAEIGHGLRLQGLRAPAT